MKNENFQLQNRRSPSPNLNFAIFNLQSPVPPVLQRRLPRFQTGIRAFGVPQTRLGRCNDVFRRVERDPRHVKNAAGGFASKGGEMLRSVAASPRLVLSR